MGLNIVLRSESDVSYFRRYFQQLLNYPDMDEVLICSGYIQEDMYNYKVLDDDLLNILVSHPNKCKLKVVTVAGKFNKNKVDDWEMAYKNFIKKLKNNSINIIPYITASRNWHAKVVIIRKDGNSIAAIIGSSNLTRPAYAEPYKFFNFECDVVIWTNEKIINNYFNDMEHNVQDPLSPIRVIIDENYNQMNENERMNGLYDVIINRDEIEIFE